MKVAIILLCTVSATFASPVDWRVIGGKDAVEGQFPHQVSLQYNGSHSCGGSILDETTILTAAHCIYGQTPFHATVVVGTTKLHKGGCTYKVKSFIQHAHYDHYEIVNDIALVKLWKRIRFNENVQPVSLPTADIGASETVTLSGWGRTSLSGNTPNDLQCIQLKTLSVKDCKARLAPTTVVDSEVCTFTQRGQGICYGDSGGPLINSDQEIIGIVSWAYPCALGYPDVYTRVYSFLDWINENWD